MSRIGLKPVTLPSGTTVSVANDKIVVKGAKGELSMPTIQDISVEISDGIVKVARANELKKTKSAHGMVRAMIQNMVIGVTDGYEIKLEIVGVGYRAQMQGSNLQLSLGFSHPVIHEAPKGIEFATDGPTKISVKGIDKQLVGQTAAIIRGYRPPEPYKGKGIRYEGEHIIRKAGKAGAK
ncbi:50S ribosomal protein L6 [Dethiosulfovibrio sp. F2B]|uniref:50S ribosomal protein L6 n=1 Tax=Dethiosulfovibrio faecalis TaxID=2720018 RepID=UPI001F178D0B|nr:50S ribosomal protein L6 [Dethiosulfovibrio faecalis]MCF4152457.1 50S ribosomal protein L6 [Dethiosulfovibrio faecalis]